jgi:hypothetical protein
MDKSLNSRLHGLLGKVYPASEITDAKKQLALEFSGGRTERTSELYDEEAKRLIVSLLSVVAKKPQSNEELTKAQRKFFALRQSLNWSYEDLSDFIIKQTGGQRSHSRQLSVTEMNTLIAVMEKIEVAQYRKRIAKGN